MQLDFTCPWASSEDLYLVLKMRTSPVEMEAYRQWGTKASYAKERMVVSGMPLHVLMTLLIFAALTKWLF